MKIFAAKKIFIFSLMILGVFFVLSFAGAQGLTIDQAVGEQSGLFSGSLTVIVARLINAALGLLGLVAVLIILYGGFLWMTAKGEAERVQKAKKLLIQALVGLLIIVMSFAIAQFVFLMLGINAWGTGGGEPSNTNGVVTPPCIGPDCGGRPPRTWCDPPTENSTAPYICSVKPKEQAKGGVLAINGGNFGDYNETSRVILEWDGDTNDPPTRYQAEVAVCEEGKPPRWNQKDKDGKADGIIKIIVPDNLPFNVGPDANNKFKVYVENGGQQSDDYRLDLVTLRNIFILTDKAPSPEIICINPDNAAQDAEIEIIGKNFGLDTQNKIIFNKNIDATVITSWTQDLIEVKVPQGAIYGEVYIADKTTSKHLSDSMDFWVTCSNTTSPYDDCASKCCRKITSYASNVCDLEKNCAGSDIGANCNINTGDEATCNPNGAICIAGLTCDSTTCKCRVPKVGDICDGDTATPSCNKNEDLCGQELTCDNSCKCQESIKITAVTPGDGAPGNYITITGKGFGQTKLGDNFIPNSDFSTSAVNFFQASQPQDQPPLPPSVFMTTISDGQVIIDVSKASRGSWYAMFGYRNIGSLLSNKTINTRYLLSFKYKGNIPVTIPMAVAVNFGDNYPNITGDHMRGIGAPIPIGNYTDWQTFEGVFTYDSVMANEFYYCVDASGALQRDCAKLKECLAPTSTATSCEIYKRYKLDIGFIQNPFNRAMKMYIDDFEVRELKSIGTVTFCGANTDDPTVNTDKCGDSDDKIAQFPYETNKNCTFNNDWQDNEIVVVVPSFDNPATPDIEPNKDGPIKVTTVSGLSAQTEPPAIADFQYITTKRPSLCRIVPPQGVYNQGLVAHGNAFGVIKGSVYIGDITDKKTFVNPGVWMDQAIWTLTVPNLKPGILPIRVKVGEEVSNPISFKILPTAKTPIINSITPTQGPTGQYLTILGTDFGNRPGTVNFYKSGTGAWNNLYVWTPGIFDFPEACADKYWSDTEIIIKVPAGANNKSEPGAAAFVPGMVMVTSAEKVNSNMVNFNHCAQNATTCPLAPGICSIVPNKAPLGTSNIVIYGDNFGSYDSTNNPSKSEVIFFSEKPALGLNTEDIWADKKIGVKKTGDSLNDPIIVPEGAVSGPVVVKDANGTASNKVNFEVVDCREKADVCDVPTEPCCQQTGACSEVSQCIALTEKSCDYRYTFKTAAQVIEPNLPEVVENSACDEDIDQSPSPWKDPTNAGDYACINAVIYARFNQAMDQATLTAGNIEVRSCSVIDDKLDKTSCVGVITSSKIDKENNGISFTPSSNLTPATWYKVTLKGTDITGIKASTGKFLDGDKNGREGGDYVWYFRTQASSEICKIETVNVNPPEKTLKLLSQTQVYKANARAANCNILAGDFNWTWYTKTTLSGNRESKAGVVAALTDITELVDTDITELVAEVEVVIKNKQLATPLKQGSVYIGAEVEDRSDEDNKLTVDLNLPEISGFTPKDGVINAQVNSYVDINGSNFGDKQGSSKIYFEKAVKPPLCATNPNDISCWTEAKLANCALAWTDISVKVIVPKDAKNGEGGAWIKIVTPFGDDNTDGIMSSPRDKNNLKVIGETFNFTVGENLYPFICQLNPNVGSEGINVAVIGDNFGDKNQISYNNQQYQVGSYVNFDTILTPILASSKIKNWSNTIINYSNPLNELSVSSVDVFVAIDPYSEPYLDKDNDGSYTGSDLFADTHDPADNLYTKVYYDTADGTVSNLESNRVEFSQPPIISSLSPNNGPVKQWVTIFGRNFGEEEGEVYFGGIIADLASCDTPVWTNNYIIAVVPPDAVVGKLDVYIKTSKEVESNKYKSFTVNTKPLGAGLCSLDPLVGQVGDVVNAVGVNFGDPAFGILNFAPSVPADITSWVDTNISGKINAGSESGFVTVIKKILTGQKCAGFGVGSWCPGGVYDNVFTEVPSNGIYFTISDGCTGYLGDYMSRDSGFPIETYSLVGGARQPYASLHVGPSATDGTYLYSIPFGGAPGKSEFGENNCASTNTCDYYNAACLTKVDTTRTIWKIGTGNNGTNLGRVYKKYHFDWSQGAPFQIPITCTDGVITNSIAPEFKGFSNIIATEKGDMYVARVVYKPIRSWTNNSTPNPWWGVGKIKFQECPDFDCTFSIEYKEIPQGVVKFNNADWPANPNSTGDDTYDLSIASNGTEIFALSQDLPGGLPDDKQGYTIQVFNQDWVLKKQFTVKKALDPNNSDIYQIAERYFTADKKYLYLIGANYITAIDWQAEEFSGAWQSREDYTRELFGAYDWANNKFWFGSYKNDTPTTDPNLGYTGDWPDVVPYSLPGHNRIYRYPGCSITEPGFCRADSDCRITGICTTSTCVNNQCTPEIKDYLPKSGPVGKWVDITGCYLGCQAGNVYFNGNTPNNAMPTSGLLAGYNFNKPDNNGWDRGSMLSGSLKNNAAISGGVLKVPAEGYLALAEQLAVPATYGEGKMTIFLRFKTDATTFVNTNWTSLISNVGGINFLGINPLNGCTPANDPINKCSKANLTTVYNTAVDATDRRDSNGASDLKFTAGQWNSLVVVFISGNGGGLKYYINGKLTDTIGISGLGMIQTAIPPRIGWKEGDGLFAGEIDDVYIYNRAFSPTEIAELFKVKALTPSDGEGACKNTWKCSADLNEEYDQIKVEVPNKKTTITTDDATTGMVKLQTKSNYVVNVGDFIVNTDTAPLSNQLCEAGALCGNNLLDAGEECDGTNVNGKTCSSTGIDLGDGSLTCKSNCTFNYSGCSLASLCGNGETDGTCSNSDISDKEICVTTSRYTWNASATPPCSNKNYTNKDACEKPKYTWTGEQCDGNSTGALDGIFATPYDFSFGEDCTKYGEPPSCIRKCSTRCKTLVCNRAGEDCSEPALCGNGNINGTCSDTSITSYQECITTEKSETTWNSETLTCSDPNYLTKSACLASENTWSGEQCDCGRARCSDATKLDQDACLEFNHTWSNNKCSDTDPNIKTKEECLAGNKTWDWDCGATFPICSDFNYGTGNLGCNLNNCKLNTSDCEAAPDTTPPYVESTSPVHGAEGFCRNGIIDIYFSELLDPLTITPANFKFGSCTGGLIARQETGIFKKAYGFAKNIVLKLIGYKNEALALDFTGCSVFDYDTVDPNYAVTYSTIIDYGADSESGFDDIHKTVVYLELLDDKLFTAAQSFGVGISPAVTDRAGNPLDTLKPGYASKLTADVLTGYYLFGFSTAGNVNYPDSGTSGICDIDNLVIWVYHDEYDADTVQGGVLTEPAQPRDLFRCAGKNDCALPAVTSSPPITADYDQDRQTSGNQHIYKADAHSSANTGDFHLSMYAQWSRSDQSDPAKMLTIYNKADDSNTDNNIVKNTNGVVYTTINKIADKENTSLLVVEAQAKGSQKAPEFKILKVDYLGCALPWRFERDEYGNSKTWYCRDTGKDSRCAGGDNDGDVCTKDADCAGAKCLLTLPPAGTLLLCSALNEDACSAPDCVWIAGACENTP